MPEYVMLRPFCGKVLRQADDSVTSYKRSASQIGLRRVVYDLIGKGIRKSGYPA